VPTDGTGVRARAVVLSRAELARCFRDNPYPGEMNPQLLHAVFLPGAPGPGLAACVADAERQVRAKGSQDGKESSAAGDNGIFSTSAPFGRGWGTR
jgi:hypothetical protein